MPKCSIVINNFNNAPFLRACLDSALGQTRSADEVILYDDGSTDSSREIIESYGSRVDAIFAKKFSPDKRLNLMNAINEGFRRSTGDLVFFLDGDDAFTSGKLAAYEAAFLANPDTVLVQAPLRLIDREGVPFGEYRHVWAHGIDTVGQVRRTRDLDYFYPTSSLGMRREFLQKIMPLSLANYPGVSPDIAFCINAVLYGHVTTLDDAWTLYRQHGSNMSKRFSKPFHRFNFDRQINRYHNDGARKLGMQPLRLWQNKRFYRRTTRHVLDLVRAPFVSR